MHLKKNPPQGVRYVYKAHMYPYKHVHTLNYEQYIRTLHTHFKKKKKQIIKYR